MLGMVKKTKTALITAVLKLTICCFTLLWAMSAAAQTSALRGKVTDEEGKPVSAASITIKGTTTGTTADDNGTFSIAAAPGKVLIISHVGFEDRQFTVGRENDINVKLTALNSELVQVIVVGYGIQKRTAVTGAISSVSGKTLNEFPVVSVQQALQGRVAGVEVT